MKIENVLMKYDYLSKIILKDNENELSKDLKIKIIKTRIEYAKVHTQFDLYIKEFVNRVNNNDEFKTLQQKQDKTDEDKAKIQEYVNKTNEEYYLYVQSRLNEDVDVSDFNFTLDEFNEIINVNINNDVEINGTKLNSADFIEALYSIFVNE